MRKGKLLRIWQNLSWLSLCICQLFAGLLLVKFLSDKGNLAENKQEVSHRKENDFKHQTNLILSVFQGEGVKLWAF